MSAPLVLLLASVLAVPHLGAAASQKGAPEAPVFTSEVSLVSVPVFVMDGRGQAQAGLRPEDFEIYDDKKPVPVVSFQYVDATSAERQEEIRRLPSARRRFLLLFDLSFTDPAGLNRAQTAARDFLRRRFALSDLAAVATFDSNRGIRMVANFTEDRGLLAHAVDTLGVPRLARIDDPLALVASAEAVDVRGGGPRGEDTPARVAAEAFLAVLARRMRSADESIYRAQVSSLMTGLEELARGLQGVEGRKQVLFFSAGFDARALVGASGEDSRDTAEAVVEGRLFDVDSNARYGDTPLRQAFAAATRSLSSADCVVHAMDVSGLGRDDPLSRRQGGQNLARDTSGRDALSFIAAETGGQLFTDRNDLGDALDEVADMTGRYYVLGYQPDDLKGAGRFHKLKVSVRRKGLKVSHRAGFHERTPRPRQSALQRKFESAQLVMTGVGPNDLSFSALCLPFPAPGERQTVGVAVQVPRQALSWGKGRPVAVEVYAYAVGSDGVVRDHLARMVRVDPGQADPRGQSQGLAFHGAFQVPPGRYTARFLVQRPETGESGVQFQELTVPPYDPRMGFLLPPVIVDEPGRWLRIDMREDRAASEAPPFVMAGQPFVPRATYQVSSGSAERLVLVAYDPQGPMDPAASVDIRSALTRADGTPVPPGPIRLLKVHREGNGRRTYVLAYTPEGLSPGDYTLRIGVGEAGTRLESYSLLRVKPANGTIVAP